MRLTLAQIRKATLVLLLIVVSAGVGYFAGQKRLEVELAGYKPRVLIERRLPSEKQDLDFALFWEVWDRLQESYWEKEKLDPAAMVYGAIKGMVAAVGDPYTVFLPPAEQKRTQEDLSGAFEGVGIQIGFKGSQLAVIAPLEGSPAQKAGVQAGDFIVGIKDERKGVDKGTFGITLPEAVEAIRGPSGTPVTLVLTRKGKDEPLEVTITRAKIEVPSVELSFEQEGQVAHLKLFRFGEQTASEWNTAVGQILSQSPQVAGVILDLRNNPGGFLNGSVVLASEFIPTGVIVIQEDSTGQRQSFSSTGAGRLYNFPLIVLVNEGSASASEIMAGAVRDHGRGRIVGEKTFGKGTIQEAQELTGGAGLHITTARWLTPAGTWLNEEGLEPDIEVSDDPETEEDEQLQRAIQLLSE